MNRLHWIVLVLTPFLLSAQKETERETIDSVLDNWHRAAAEADFESYFGAMTDNAVFIGTDATENWSKAEFMEFSKPYFDRGKAWNFKAVERHIYVSDEGTIAWFDELLDTWMELCRGSGVLLKENGEWKIGHYVLSIAVPNEQVEALIPLKAAQDSLLLQSLKSKQ